MDIELLWTPQAEKDLFEIYEFIAIDSSVAADRILSKLQGKIETLIEYPRLGLRKPEIRPSARLLIESPYLILYETHPDTDEGPVSTVEIVRIIDGRRDLKSLF